MHDGFSDALAEAGRLAACGDAWEALARLQAVDVEDVLLRLLHHDLRGLAQVEREEAVGHAVTAVYEQWAGGLRVPSILGFLKVAAQNKANTLRRSRLATHPLEPDHDQLPEVVDPAHDDPVERRRQAVKVARTFLPELGMQGLIDTFGYQLDLIDAGADASATAIARDLDLEYSTVTTRLKRAYDRLALRVSAADLDALLADDDTDDDEPDDDLLEDL